MYNNYIQLCNKLRPKNPEITPKLDHIKCNCMKLEVVFETDLA